MRIAAGGFHIESCTFSPLPAREADFVVLRGDDLRRSYAFVSGQDDLDFVPLVRARALPGGPVEKSFYDAVKDEFLSGLRVQGPWDGVFLHMHGAVSVSGMEDAEGDWIAAVRDVVGPDCLIAASYDLHGNVSQRVFDSLDLLSAYRTAPHVDWVETLERTFGLLVTCLRGNIRPYKTWIPIPVLLPGEQTSTGWEPAARLYKLIPEVIAPGRVMDASLLIGYVWADEPRASASALAFGTDQAAVQQAAKTLAQQFWDARRDFHFGTEAGPVDHCIRMALDAVERPVVISDSGDNPTAGGAGDVPYVLERLLALEVPDAVFASIADPAAVALCAAAGSGAAVDLSLGGKLDPVHAAPLQVHGEVRIIVDLPTQIYDVGAASGVNRAAVVQVQGVQVIVTERRTPFHTLADFRRLGIEPAQHALIVVKIGYLEPELAQLAAVNFLALSPGAVNQDIEKLPFKRIRRPVYPLDRDMVWRVPG